MQNQGSIIAGLIKLAGYSQKEVAGIAGIGAGYLSRTLKLEPVPRSLVKQIAQIIGVTEAQLITPGTVPPYRYSDNPSENDAVAPRPGETSETGADLRKDIASIKKEIERLANEQKRWGATEEKLLNIIEQLTKK